jgi:hypothetical protein
MDVQGLNDCRYLLPENTISIIHGSDNEFKQNKKQ